MVPRRIMLSKLHIWCPECKSFMALQAQAVGDVIMCVQGHLIGVYRA